MYFGLRFDRRTHAALWLMFVMAFAADSLMQGAHDDAQEAGRLFREAVRLRAENVRLERENRDLARPVDTRGRRLTEADVEALVRLAWKESRWSPTAKNPRSTATGMWQFLDGSWKGTGVRKTHDPYWQTVAALRYVRSRYSTPQKALAFHDREGWY